MYRKLKLVDRCVRKWTQYSYHGRIKEQLFFTIWKKLKDGSHPLLQVGDIAVRLFRLDFFEVCNLMLSIGKHFFFSSLIFPVAV